MQWRRLERPWLGCEADTAETRLEWLQLFVEHQHPIAKNRHAVGDRLHAGQVVRREENGNPSVGQFRDYFLEECLASHHVQTEGRIVQDQEVR